MDKLKEALIWIVATALFVVLLISSGNATRDIELLKARVYYLENMIEMDNRQ